MSEKYTNVSEDFVGTVEDVLELFEITVEYEYIPTGRDTVIRCKSRVLEFNDDEGWGYSIKVREYDGEAIDDTSLFTAIISRYNEGDVLNLSFLETTNTQGQQVQALIVPAEYTNQIDDEILQAQDTVFRAAFNFYERLDSLLLDVGIAARAEYELQKYNAPQENLDNDNFEAYIDELILEYPLYARIQIYEFAGSMFCRLDIEHEDSETTYEYDLENRKLDLIIDSDDEYSIDCTMSIDDVNKFHDICMAVFDDKSLY